MLDWLNEGDSTRTRNETPGSFSDTQTSDSQGQKDQPKLQTGPNDSGFPVFPVSVLDRTRNREAQAIDSEAFPGFPVFPVFFQGVAGKKMPRSLVHGASIADHLESVRNLVPVDELEWLSATAKTDSLRVESICRFLLAAPQLPTAKQLSEFVSLLARLSSLCPGQAHHWAEYRQTVPARVPELLPYLRDALAQVSP